MSLTDISRRLDEVTVDAIGQNSRRLLKKMGDDLDLKQQFQKLEMVLDGL